MSKMTIYKYPIPVEDEFSIEIPDGGTVLVVQTQRAAPFVWVRVDPSRTPRPRRFCLRGTGHPDVPTDDDARYIGTFQMCDGALVFHLFEYPDPVHVSFIGDPLPVAP